LTFPPAGRRLFFAALIGLIAALYLLNLTGMGLVSADEPRYAAIGRAMADSGDWVTPRLWGQPWFEKPALLYWMTASAFRLGLGPDLAPRLPVALLSITFLAFFWWRLRIEWGARTASFAAAMLATSAGWLAFSHVAVTDLPLAVFFSAAVLLSLPCIARGDGSLLPVAAACLGLATLAKGLVPLVLFLPVFAIGWRNWRVWASPMPIFAFLLCSLPWYVICTLRNGIEFPRVFFVQQTFARFGSAALQHVQPVWFYFPALLLLLYPWFPLMIFPGRGFSLPMRDARVRTLAAVVVFGFIFFSVALNKLPGYLLPLLPGVFTLLGVGIARVPRPGFAMIGPVMLLGALPFLSKIAPVALAHGLRSANIPWQNAIAWLLAAGAAGIMLALVARKRAFPVAASLAAAGFLWFQIAAFPEFDAVASARPLWLRTHPECAPPGTRSALYGLYYYAEKKIPDCTVLDQNVRRGVR
jgi:4-amino-4-deoxy-L-arabinose transferase-like glycosyltransferase